MPDTPPAVPDTLSLSGVQVWAHHGVEAHEQQRGQRFLVDVTLELDLSPAAASDRLGDTADYGALARRVADAARAGPDDAPGHRLIEAVAGRVARACLDAVPRATAAEVVVHKPDAPLPVPVEDVRVRLRRER